MNTQKPVIIYLDQNKWIQITRLLHGIETDSYLLKRVVRLLKYSEEGKIILPLSAIHLLETQRIKDAERRKNLGRVMWKYSDRNRMLSSRGIIIYEIKNALHEMRPGFPKPSLKLIGHGLEHAFGTRFDKKLDPLVDRAAEYSILTGETLGGILPPLQYLSNKFKESFARHLAGIPTIDRELPEKNWQDYLSAITIKDILNPIHDVFKEYNLDASAFGSREFLETFISKMPTRRLDIHLHTQIFRNKRLKPKLNDLEDWAALGPACMYCDYAVCEKHFANLVRRDNFQTKATVCTDFAFIDELQNLESETLPPLRA